MYEIFGLSRKLYVYLIDLILGYIFYLVVFCV